MLFETLLIASTVVLDCTGFPFWVLNCGCVEPQLLTCLETAP